MGREAKLAAALVMMILWAASLWYGFNAGKRVERADWQQQEIQRQAAERQAILDQVETNRLIQKANDANNRRIADAYEERLAQLRKDADADRNHAPGDGLRLPATICNQAAGSAKAASSGQPDEAGANTVELPPGIEGRLFTLTERADSLAEQLRSLQQWINDNGFYGMPANE